MRYVIFWAVAVIVWGAGVFGLALLANWLFDDRAAQMVFAGMSGALWGIVAYGIGAVFYDEHIR